MDGHRYRFCKYTLFYKVQRENALELAQLCRVFLPLILVKQDVHKYHIIVDKLVIKIYKMREG